MEEEKQHCAEGWEKEQGGQRITFMIKSQFWTPKCAARAYQSSILASNSPLSSERAPLLWPQLAPWSPEMPAWPGGRFWSPSPSAQTSVSHLFDPGLHHRIYWHCELSSWCCSIISRDDVCHGILLCNTSKRSWCSRLLYAYKICPPAKLKKGPPGYAGCWAGGVSFSSPKKNCFCTDPGCLNSCTSKRKAAAKIWDAAATRAPNTRIGC